jgi:hypothetical protein
MIVFASSPKKLSTVAILSKSLSCFFYRGFLRWSCWVDPWDVVGESSLTVKPSEPRRLIWCTRQSDTSFVKAFEVSSGGPAGRIVVMSWESRRGRVVVDSETVSFEPGRLIWYTWWSSMSFVKAFEVSFSGLAGRILVMSWESCHGRVVVGESSWKSRRGRVVVNSETIKFEPGRLIWCTRWSDMSFVKHLPQQRHRSLDTVHWAVAEATLSYGW